MKILQNFKRRSLFITLALFSVFAVAATAACSNDSDDGQTATPSAPDVAPLSIGSAQTDLGAFLTGPEGRTLYIFTKDGPNTSNCKDGCLTVWPPLLATNGQPIAASAAKGSFGSINTPMGRQVTYNEAPLYYYAGDTKAGDTTGHLVGGNWFVARPDTASTAIVGVSGTGESAYLVGPTGMSLYLFANDAPGTSNCNGQCIKNWPALTVPAGQDPTGVAAAPRAKAAITRADDGTRQLTYNGGPLYYFAGDKLPGDTTGDGVGGVWSLAKP